MNLGGSLIKSIKNKRGGGNTIHEKVKDGKDD